MSDDDSTKLQMEVEYLRLHVARLEDELSLAKGRVKDRDNMLKLAVIEFFTQPSRPLGETK